MPTISFKVSVSFKYWIVFSVLVPVSYHVISNAWCTALAASYILHIGYFCYDGPLLALPLMISR